MGYSHKSVSNTRSETVY